jgi:hypothetical protein
VLSERLGSDSLSIGEIGSRGVLELVEGGKDVGR